MERMLTEHPTTVALMLGVEGVDRDTRVDLEVDEHGYLILKVTDEKLDHPLPQGMYERAKAHAGNRV